MEIMKKNLSLVICLMVCAMAITICGCNESNKLDGYKILEGSHLAVTPASRGSQWWQNRHKSILDRVAKGNVDLVFIGDSITQGWYGYGKTVWPKYYANRNAVNMGFSGDKTQNILWRIENGQLDGINPKLIVLLAGVNNSNLQENTSEEIADGVILICKRIREKLPRTKILIMAIFPVNQAPTRHSKDTKAIGYNPQWAKNNKANEIISTIADGKTVFYMNINQKLLDENGQWSRQIAPDFVHPSKLGYEIWAQQIEPLVMKIMSQQN
jgi:lysophospholipase L1-like esterase